MKYWIGFLIMIVSFVNIYAKNDFFIQNRTGLLVRIDPASGLHPKYPEKKGPVMEEIALEYTPEDYKSNLLDLIKNQDDREFVETLFKKEDNGSFTLIKGYLPVGIPVNVIKRSVFSNLNDPEKKLFEKYYKLDNKAKLYKLSGKVTEKEIQSMNRMTLFILRVLLLHYNEKNEMKTSFLDKGTPMPHQFPRFFETDSKGYFDIHFVWGVKFEPIADHGFFTLGFSFNLTNLVMPSLELMLKYNFFLKGYDYPLDPFVGLVVYGGWLDGFPIGIDAIGGVDIYPEYPMNQTKFFFLSAEARLGLVLYSKIYFDTGKNSEGIWKGLQVLTECGFYFGPGYRFDNVYEKK